MTRNSIDAAVHATLYASGSALDYDQGPRLLQSTRPVYPQEAFVKKIEGVGAGRLIDQCGLKGFRIGDAQISHIHANIMVNLGSATGADVIALIRHAQNAVKEKFGYELEPEINFVGEF